MASRKTFKYLSLGLLSFGAANMAACGPESSSVEGTGGAVPTATGGLGAGGGAGGTVASGSGGTSSSGGSGPGSGGEWSGGGGAPGAGTGGAASGGAPGAGGSPDSTTDAYLEDNGLDCTIGELPASIAANSKLPDPFEKLDGTRLSSKSDWRCHRKLLRAKAERYVFGKKEGKPDTVTGTVTNSQVSVSVSHGGQSISFNSNLELPSSGSAPYPVVVAVGNTADDNTIKSQGVAILRYDAFGVGSESSRNPKSGRYYTIYGGTNPTGILAAWAWGVSRIIDVIEASDGSILDKNAIGVSGCSRYGKAAFAIGALDERIALSIPFESGTGGVGIYRGIGTGEDHPDSGQDPAQSLSSGYGEAPWLGDAFQPFINSINTLPIDSHEIVALYAPRGLLILDNPHIGHLGGKWAHASALAGVEVYKALGVEDNFSYLSNTGSGTHCSVRSEYQEPLRQAIQKHFFKNSAATGGSIATTKWPATASDWIDWTTPTLQ